MSFRTEKIGNATLILGDCREVLPTLGKVDAVVTDPPYGISLAPQRRLTQAIQGDGRDEAKELWAFLAEQVIRLAKPDTGHMFWTRWSETWTKDVLSRRMTVKSCVVWAKNMWGIGYYTRPQHEMAWYCHVGKPPVPKTADSDLWSVAKIQAPIHSCEKPAELMKRCVRLCDHSGDGVVLDPFMGVGSTGVAAVSLGRSFIGVELDQTYFDLACFRVEQAQRQRDLFLAPAPEPVQTDLLEGAA